MIQSRISPALMRRAPSASPPAARRARGRPPPRAGPRARAARPRARSVTVSARQAGGDRVEHVRVRAAEVVQREPQQLDRRAVLGQQRLAVAGRRERREREHDRQVVGQLGRLHGQPGGAVELLQAQQRHAALARVAVRVVGQVQARAAAQVERLDVARRQRGLVARPAGEEALERVADRPGGQRGRPRRRSRRARRPRSASG